MIHPHFLDPKSQRELVELTQDGSAAHRQARCADALVLLDNEMSCTPIAKVLFLDDDTVRTWYHLHQEDRVKIWRFWPRRGVCRLTIGTPDQTALRPCLLPATLIRFAAQADRAIVKVNAQTHHPQQTLRYVQGLQCGDADLPVRPHIPKLANIPR